MHHVKCNYRVVQSGLMGIRLALLAALVLSADFSGSGLLAQNKFSWGKVSPDEWNFNISEKFPHEPAIVLLDIGYLKVETDHWKLDRHLRYKVLNRQAAQDVTNMQLFFSGQVKVGKISAQTILPNNKKFGVNSNAIMRKEVGEEYFIYSFTFPSVADSCIVELKYSISSEQTYRELPTWHFQGSFYTRTSQFTFSTCPHFIFNTITLLEDSLSLPIEEFTHIDGEKVKQYTWTLHDVSPLAVEPSMGARLNYLPSIYIQFSGYDFYSLLPFVYIQNWNDLTSIARYFTERKMETNDTLAGFVDSLVADAGPGVESKVARLHSFVRDKVSTKVEMSPHFLPAQSAAETFRTRSGSNADKNLLLVQMLQELDLFADPILVATRDHARFTTSILNMAQFDYLLCHVLIDSTAYVLDATLGKFPFPHLHPSLRSRGGLLLPTKRTLEARRLPFETYLAIDTVTFDLPTWDSGVRNVASIWIESDGSAICSSHVRLTGYEQYNPIYDSTRTIDDALLHAIFNSLRDKSLELLEGRRLSGIDSDSTAYELVFRIADFAAISGDLITFLPSLIWSGENKFVSEERQFPVDFGYPSFYSETIDIHIPPQFTVLNLPEQRNELKSDIMFSRAILSGDNSTRVMTSLLLKSDFFPPNRYGQLRKVFQSLEDCVNQPFTARMAN